MRWRNMYYMTGLPGWMRFGYSPGWGGMPPGAAYLYQTGQLPAFWSWWGQQAPGPMPGPWGGQGAPTPMPGPWGMQPPGPEQEIDWLSARARDLEEELQAIKERLDELTKERG